MSKVIFITGAAGLIGSEAAEFFSDKFDLVVGIDNDMRKFFFGKEASNLWNKERLENNINNYKHYSIDIRDKRKINRLFKKYNKDIKLIIHTAAQPSHDWAAKRPFEDFTTNAFGTLILLEAMRYYSPEAVFIFTSTNKVYGNNPNKLPLVELKTRWEIQKGHKYENGIDESMSIDNTLHSIFGVSKTSADLLVQEYGKYFNLKTGVFRGGCLTGPHHSGTQLHGFLSYLMKCAITKTPYTIFGYKGKQVRDNIHSYDLVNMFYHFYKQPLSGEVFNVGGSRHSNCSILEAISLAEEITGNKMEYNYTDKNRVGDHIWWISDVSKFKNSYPDWHYKYTLEDIMLEIYKGIKKRV